MTRVVLATKGNASEMRRLLIALLFLTACGRPLTPSEQAFAQSIHGPTLNYSSVRLHDGAPTRAVTFKRKPG